METTQNTKSKTTTVKLTRKQQRLAAHREFQQALRDEMRKGPVK